MTTDTRTRTEKLTFIAFAHDIPDEMLTAAIANGMSVDAFALEVAAIVRTRREVDELAAQIAAA